jgi:hypothetical protein
MSAHQSFISSLIRILVLGLATRGLKRTLRIIQWNIIGFLDYFGLLWIFHWIIILKCTLKQGSCQPYYSFSVYIFPPTLSKDQIFILVIYLLY